MAIGKGRACIQSPNLLKPDIPVYRDAATNNDLASRGLAEPFVAVTKMLKELLRRLFREVESLTLACTLGQRVFRANAIYASGFFMNATLVVTCVINPLLIHIGDMNAAVRADLNIHRPEPRVG